jgi:hypothetical protein
MMAFKLQTCRVVKNDTNPSIEGVSKRLRLLCAPLVKR